MKLFHDQENPEQIFAAGKRSEIKVISEATNEICTDVSKRVSTGFPKVKSSQSILKNAVIQEDDEESVLSSRLQSR